MMYKEFKDRTGVQTSDEEYSFIEQSYYDSGLDKDSFCKRWKDDLKSDRWSVELALRRKLSCMTDELGSREKKIHELEKQLDREQDWKPSENTGTRLTQELYIDLSISCGGYRMTYANAKNLIAKEFGFQIDKIEIVTEVETFEVNRHHKLRCKDVFKREPIYNASDWNYVRFNVAGLQYEMIDGELEQYFD